MLKTAVKSKAKVSSAVKISKKTIYFFGGGKADGKASMKNLLGGKGANLAEMAGHPDLRLPVPPGFTLTTEICTYYWGNKRSYPKGLTQDVEKNLRKVEELTGKKFGDAANPLLVSVRSGARSSMPGMMETILNVGLTEGTIPGLIDLTSNPRFVYDSYRRLIMMYSDVVMEKAAGIEPADDKGIRKQLERIMHDMKTKKGAKSDTDLTAEDLKELSVLFKAKVKEVLKKEFPDNPMDQLWGSIGAVFASWMGKRAVSYRRIEGIPGEWGTAVSVQTMVFGNMGDESSTGVGFTRNPGTGENAFFGEFLENAQGEDVVAGIRTPRPINEASRNDQSKGLKSLEQLMPKAYKELAAIRAKLEKHYHDMLDIEFTIEKGKLYMLQCRVGKRNGLAAVRMALDMHKEKLATKEEVVMRVTPDQLDELLHPILDPKIELATKPIGKGLPAGPGGAVGMIVFTAEEAVKWRKADKHVILVREETNPEDVEGMRAAEAILTARGGMTSHAALVARGWGKCCVVGCADVKIDLKAKTLSLGGEVLKEGDWISLNGSRGLIYTGKMALVEPGGATMAMLNDFLKYCNSIRALKVWTNAETPADSAQARSYGAEGIGLFRIEHMFYGKGSDQPLFKLRKMIMSRTLEERKAALNELFPHMKADIKATFKVMEGLHVTVRLMDPPLHEFVPHQKEKLQELAASLHISYDELETRATALRESNPMMGHRGVRLGVTYPEITEMQARAIFEAAAELHKEGIKVFPDIMIPVVSLENEVKHQAEIIHRVYAEVMKQKGVKVKYMVGTMIEIPRACLLAGKLSETMEFFSFGTNDLTQMTFGYSRDDSGFFLAEYQKDKDKDNNPRLKIIPNDPFVTIDQDGVGELIKIAVERGRKTRKDLKIGICGEHGGEPASVYFCHKAGLNYVSCSPFRVPIAILSAAQSQIRSPRKNKGV
ncbi:MAG: pyruvate, phosphate dikinase [Elusimicrobia bacterium CG_4_10_14_0_2_um_filter_56_8]|nr:MAG: pyruvate, phosphate dikinase [Elusimicrobia bacterium CG1_02_56_21]PJA16370.1 MAG: pyruvate, phosphate dikinase [Elusimicrobia bacterium CG_4_10_14_0_2_um_filter_56_8]